MSDISGSRILISDKESHHKRRREILKKYPQIKALIGRNKNSFYAIICLVSIQIALAWFCSTQAWWIILLVAYFFGTFINHSLFTLIHEATHNLIFKRKIHNIWAGILCDIPNGLPTSVTFHKYHLLHHIHQGDSKMDPDSPSEWEIRLVKNSTIRKMLWLLFFPFIQIARTLRFRKKTSFLDKDILLNIGVVLAFDILIIWIWGWGAWIYFLLCCFLCLGLHPLGARWIQEHYLTFAPQTTCNYYGILNKINFNIGYHNEHHDFMAVPWNKLPKIRDIASEYYNTLPYHTSLTKLFFLFLFDKRISLNTKVIRKSS